MSALLSRLMEVLERKPDKAHVERLRAGINRAVISDFLRSVMLAAIDDYINHNPGLK